MEYILYINTNNKFNTIIMMLYLFFLFFNNIIVNTKFNMLIKTGVKYMIVMNIKALKNWRINAA